MDHHAALAVSLLGALSLACGAEEERGLDEAGVSGAVDASTEDVLAELDALGYAGGTEVGEGEVGVLHHDPQRARQGLNFYVCGHAAEAVLMDMEGTELHRWQYGFHEAFPDAREEPNAEERGRHHWRRAYLLEDGSLIAIFDGQGLIRVGPDSLLRWANPLRAHHAAHVLESGELFVLSRENHVARVLGKEQPVAEDFVTQIDPETGATLRQVSLLRAMQESDFRPLMETGPKVRGDIFHTNSLQVLDGRFTSLPPAFRAGNVLLSSRTLNALFVADLDQVRVVWARQGSFRGQHEAQMLDDGRLLLFDNRGTEPHSRILELSIDPAEEHVVYEGTDTARFYSKLCGAVARLPGGNTLITQTNGGRALEITPEREIVWEFVNPHTTGDKIASVYEMVRLRPDSVRGWR